MSSAPRTPEDVHRLWSEYFVAGDLEGLVSLYEPDAALLAQSGAFVTGRRAIREVLAGFIAVRRAFEIKIGPFHKGGFGASLAGEDQHPQVIPPSLTKPVSSP